MSTRDEIERAFAEERRNRMNEESLREHENDARAGLGLLCAGLWAGTNVLFPPGGRPGPARESAPSEPVTLGGAVGGILILGLPIVTGFMIASQTIAMAEFVNPGPAGPYYWIYYWYFRLIHGWLGMGFSGAMTNVDGPVECVSLLWHVLIRSWIALAVLPLQWVLMIIGRLAKVRVWPTGPVLMMAWLATLVLPQVVILLYCLMSAFHLEAGVLPLLSISSRSWLAGVAVFVACLVYFAIRARRQPAAGAPKPPAPRSLASLQADAEAGDATAQFDLGVMYYSGQGAEQDNARAASWYLRAAQQGHARAQRCLATLFTCGSGVDRDDTEALAWLYLCTNGNIYDTEALDTRDRLEGELGPEMVSGARQRSKELLAHIETARAGN